MLIEHDRCPAAGCGCDIRLIYNPHQITITYYHGEDVLLQAQLAGLPVAGWDDAFGFEILCVLDRRADLAIREFHGGTR